MSHISTAPKRRAFRLKPGTILNLIVFLVVAIGLLIYYRPPRPIIPSIDQASGMINAPVAVPTVLDVRVHQMDRISFHRDSEAFTLEYDGARWNITAPFVDRADERLTMLLVEALADIAYDEEIEAPGPDAIYGFDAALIRAEFGLRDGTEQTLLIGQPEGSIEYFVKTSASDSVYLVRNLPERLFTMIAGEMVHGQLLEFNPADVRKVTAVTSTGQTRVIEREGDSWFADTEYGRALVFDVDTFLRDLSAISSSSIAAPGEAERWEELGLAPVPQTMSLEVELTDGNVHSLAVGAATADGRRYYVRSSDRPHAYVVVEFSATNLESKLTAATTDILRVNPARVTRVDVTTPNDPAATVRTFARDNNNHSQWIADQRVAFYVPQLVESINGVTTFQRAPDGSEASFGFTGPGALHLTVTMENKATYTLEIGSTTHDGKHVYVRSSTRDGVYLAAFDTVEAIRDGLSTVRTHLLPFETPQLEEIKIETVASDGSITENTLMREGESWLLNGRAIDQAKVETLITRLRGLRAEKLPPPVAEDAYKFYPAANSLRAHVRSSDGSELVLDIGAAVQEGTTWFATTSHYARVSNLEPVVFIADRDQSGLRTAINSAIQ